MRVFECSTEFSPIHSGSQQLRALQNECTHAVADSPCLCASMPLREASYLTMCVLQGELL